VTRQASIRSWAAALKRDVVAVGIALRDPRTPWAARLPGVLVVAYACSPIDLIPDFIPLLGLLDDLLLPLGIWLVVALLPPEVLADARRQAEEGRREGRGGRVAAVVIAGVWVAAAVLGWVLLQPGATGSR
jgi:uncharacterized membrane protein YkvA (DUF1232 family)